MIDYKIHLLKFINNLIELPKKPKQAADLITRARVLLGRRKNEEVEALDFTKVQGERLPIVHVPYTQSELNDLITRNENSLLTHLIQCQTCQVSHHDYCAYASVIGGDYEAMLLCFEDAERRHDTFMTKVTKVRLSSGKPLVRLVQQTKVRRSHDE